MDSKQGEFQKRREAPKVPASPEGLFLLRGLDIDERNAEPFQMVAGGIQIGRGPARNCAARPRCGGSSGMVLRASEISLDGGLQEAGIFAEFVQRRGAVGAEIA